MMMSMGREGISVSPLELINSVRKAARESWPDLTKKPCAHPQQKRSDF